MRFTVRRPPIGEVSPCSHRPSGGDVACSVDVGVAPASSAGLALENRLALTVPGSDVPARRASLRRIRGRDLLDPTASLVLQTRGEQPPTAAADHRGSARASEQHRTPGCSTVPRAVRVIARTSRASIRIVSNRRAMSVVACSTQSLRRSASRAFSFAIARLRSRAPVGATPGSREPLLQHRQPLGLTCGQTGCVQQFAGRQRRRYGNPTVDAHHASITWTGDRVRDVGERDVPAASPITGNPVGLDPLRHRPPQANRTQPTLGTHTRPQRRLSRSRDAFDRDLPKSFMLTGLAPRRATMRPGEKVLHGLCEIPQRLLLHRLTPGTKPPILSASRRQLRSLLDIAGSLAARLPVLLLLNRQIPHIACVPTVHQQCLFLLRDRQQPKPRHIRK